MDESMVGLFAGLLFTTSVFASGEAKFGKVLKLETSTEIATLLARADDYVGPVVK
jgi:hypothetical protein